MTIDETVLIATFGSMIAGFLTASALRNLRANRRRTERRRQVQTRLWQSDGLLGQPTDASAYTYAALRLLASRMDSSPQTLRTVLTYQPSHRAIFRTSRINRLRLSRRGICAEQVELVLTRPDQTTRIGKHRTRYERSIGSRTLIVHARLPRTSSLTYQVVRAAWGERLQVPLFVPGN